MFRDLTLLTLSGNRMDWVAKRQEVLAENIANANMPQYTPKKINEFDFKKMLEQAVPTLRLKRTSTNHLTPPMDSPAKLETHRRSYEVSPDGNGVILEEQTVSLSEGKNIFNTSSNIYDKQYKMMRLSIGNRQ